MLSSEFIRNRGFVFSGAAAWCFHQPLLLAQVSDPRQ
jgi:hypothetical protein